MNRAQRRAFDPGRMRHRIAIEAPTTVHDDRGGHEAVWTQIATCMAEMVVLSADAIDRARGDDRETSHLFTLRHRRDLDAGHRLVCSGRIFEIRTIIDPDETGRLIQVTTRERIDP